MSGCHPTIEDRVTQLGEEARALANAGNAIFGYFWPNDVMPRILSKLA